MKTFISNRPGTVAIAHGIGVNGNSDIFINLEDYVSTQQTCKVAGALPVVSRVKSPHL